MDKETVLRLAIENGAEDYGDRIPSDFDVYKFAALIEAELSKEAALGAGAEPVAVVITETCPGVISSMHGYIAPQTATRKSVMLLKDIAVGTALYANAQSQAETAELVKDAATAFDSKYCTEAYLQERIAELEHQLAESGELIKKFQQLHKDTVVLCDRNADRVDELKTRIFKAETERGVMIEEFDKAQARIAQLENALNTCRIVVVTSGSYQCFNPELVANALQEPASDWLTKHDDEVLERAAKVCDVKWTEWISSAAREPRSSSWPDGYTPYDCAKSIRALKVL